MTEKELVNLLQQQDIRAQKLFVVQFQEGIFRLSLKLLLNQNDAEDATQEALMDSLTHITQFNFDSSLKTWVYRIATNRCLQFMRAQKRKKRFAILRSLFATEQDLEPIAVVDESNDTQRILENKELSLALKNAIFKLSESQRVAFSLVYLNEHTYQESADVMEIGIKALESLLSRAKKKLREHLGELGYENK